MSLVSSCSLSACFSPSTMWCLPPRDNAERRCSSDTGPSILHFPASKSVNQYTFVHGKLPSLQYSVLAAQNRLRRVYYYTRTITRRDWLLYNQKLFLKFLWVITCLINLRLKNTPNLPRGFIFIHIITKLNLIIKWDTDE